MRESKVLQIKNGLESVTFTREGDNVLIRLDTYDAETDEVNSRMCVAVDAGQLDDVASYVKKWAAFFAKQRPMEEEV